MKYLRKQPRRRPDSAALLRSAIAGYLGIDEGTAITGVSVPSARPGLSVTGFVCRTREQERLEEQAHAEHADKLRLALWRLDARIRNVLAREDSRPFNHYSAVFAPPLALDAAGAALPARTGALWIRNSRQISTNEGVRFMIAPLSRL